MSPFPLTEGTAPARGRRLFRYGLFCTAQGTLMQPKGLFCTAHPVSGSQPGRGRGLKSAEAAAPYHSRGRSSLSQPRPQLPITAEAAAPYHSRGLVPSRPIQPASRPFADRPGLPQPIPYFLGHTSLPVSSLRIPHFPSAPGFTAPSSSTAAGIHGPHLGPQRADGAAYLLEGGRVADPAGVGRHPRHVTRPVRRSPAGGDQRGSVGRGCPAQRGRGDRGGAAARQGLSDRACPAGAPASVRLSGRAAADAPLRGRDGAAGRV